MIINYIGFIDINKNLIFLGVLKFCILGSELIL